VACLTATSFSIVKASTMLPLSPLTDGPRVQPTPLRVARSIADPGATVIAIASRPSDRTSNISSSRIRASASTPPIFGYVRVTGIAVRSTTFIVTPRTGRKVTGTIVVATIITVTIVPRRCGGGGNRSGGADGCGRHTGTDYTGAVAITVGSASVLSPRNSRDAHGCQRATHPRLRTLDRQRDAALFTPAEGEQCRTCEGRGGNRNIRFMACSSIIRPLLKTVRHGGRETLATDGRAERRS